MTAKVKVTLELDIDEAHRIYECYARGMAVFKEKAYSYSEMVQNESYIKDLKLCTRLNKLWRYVALNSEKQDLFRLFNTDKPLIGEVKEEEI